MSLGNLLTGFLSSTTQGITERLARKNAFVTRAKLKEYLSSARASSAKKEEFAVTRLKELRGEKTEEEQRLVEWSFSLHAIFRSS